MQTHRGMEHRTGHADFPHPALGQDVTPLPTARCSQKFVGCAKVRSTSTIYQRVHGSTVRTMTAAVVVVRTVLLRSRGGPEILARTFAHPTAWREPGQTQGCGVGTTFIPTLWHAPRKCASRRR